MSRALAIVLLLAVILAAPIVADVPTVRRAQADDGLTSTIASAYFPRYVDTTLHAIAHERVAELAACECLNHDGIRPSTAEVIAFNGGADNPIQTVLNQWQESPPHNDILSNRSYGRIGCAELVDGDTHWFACVLTWGELPPETQGAAAPPQGGALLPNTALPPGE
jgi:hypothetical protein